MPPQRRPSCYTLSTNDGNQATLHVAPDDDPWQAATHYARASVASDSHLAELRIASETEIAGFTAHLVDAPPPEPGSGE